MNILQNYFNQIVMLLLLALAAFLGGQARSLYRKLITTEIKQSVCRTAVRFVEQVYLDLHGPEKLAQAMAKASEILEEYGITISETELVAMIEAAVNEFNNAFGLDAAGRHLKAQGIQTGPAVEDPPETEQTQEPASVGKVTLAEIIAEAKDVD